MVVHVVGPLQILDTFFVNEAIEVIDLNSMLFHHGKSGVSELLGALIANDDFYFFLRSRARWCGGGKNQFRSLTSVCVVRFVSLGFHLGSDALETFSIGLRRGFFILRPAIPVPQAEVEVDHVPVTITKPGIHLLIAISRPAAVAIDAVDVGFARQIFANHGGVTNRNRVSDDQHPWQGGVISRVGKGIDQRIGAVSSPLFLFRLLRLVRLWFGFFKCGFDFLSSRLSRGIGRSAHWGGFRIHRRARFQIGGNVCHILSCESELTSGHHQ